MNEEKIKNLIELVKIHLNITWSDVNTETRIRNYVEDGIIQIKKYAGNNDIDFTKAGEERELLLSYCRYANSDALEMFKENYMSELLSLNLEYRVKERSDNETTTA